MEDNTAIVDITFENFESTVIAGSRARPVLVDFWAPWCEPCKTLTPILEKLATEFGGAFLLAKVDTDAQRELAQAFAIRSVPTVMLVKDGQVVEQFMGAQPESVIRKLIESHVGAAPGDPLGSARAALEKGDVDQASVVLDEIIAGEPDNVDAKLLRSECALAGGDLDGAERRLADLPLDVQVGDAYKRLAARLSFQRMVAGHPDMPSLEIRAANDDPEAMQALAAHRLLADDAEGALDLMLKLMRKHRGWNEGAAHQTILAAFELLGPHHPLVDEYRRRLVALLY